MHLGSGTLYSGLDSPVHGVPCSASIKMWHCGSRQTIMCPATVEARQQGHQGTNRYWLVQTFPELFQPAARKRDDGVDLVEGSG